MHSGNCSIKVAAGLLALFTTACLINSGRKEVAAVTLPSFLRWDAEWQRSVAKVFGVRKEKKVTWSSMQSFPDLPPNMEWRPADAPQKEYHVFRNIQIVDAGVRFYHLPDSPPPADAPTNYQFWSRTPKDVNVSISYRKLPQGHWNPFDSCVEKHSKPVVTFDVTDNNFFHWLNEIALPSFHMILDHGFMPKHVTRALECMEGADANTAHTCAFDLRAPSRRGGVTYVAMRRPGENLPSGGGRRIVPDALESTRAHLLTHMSTDLQYWEDLEGHCFDTLVLGHTELTDIAISYLPEEGVADRKRILEAYQKYAFISAMTDKLAAAHNYSSQAEAQKMIAAAVGYQQRKEKKQVPQIMLASRRPPLKRAILNEEDMVQFIQDRWDAQLVVGLFEKHLLDIISSIRQADVFMGMHGAGFTNLIFLPPGTTVLQMFPWGWLRDDGIVEREAMYMNIATALNATYFHWLSPLMKNGLLQADQCADGVRTPPNATLPPHNHAMAYQDTHVDLSALEGTLDDAFSAAGISRRGGDKPAGKKQDGSRPPSDAGQSESGSRAAGGGGASAASSDAGGGDGGGGGAAVPSPPTQKPETASSGSSGSSKRPAGGGKPKQRKRRGPPVEKNT